MPVSNNKKYHLLLLGDDSELRKKVSSKFKSICLDDFKLDENSLWIDNNPENIGCYNDLICCVYFARECINNIEDMMLSELIEYSMPVIPVVENNREINCLPECIKNLNAVIQDKDSDVCLTIVSNICRFFGLIRSERRVFISYARMDSAGIALQLFDALNRFYERLKARQNAVSEEEDAKALEEERRMNELKEGISRDGKDDNGNTPVEGGNG